jgi:hypothetical protein
MLQDLTSLLHSPSASRPSRARPWARWLLVGGACAALPAVTACDGDLFNDTSWIYNVCPVDEGPQAAACVLDAAPGIFVRLEGDNAASGTREAPVSTLQKAIDLAAAGGGPGRVYVCAQTFAEPIVVPSGVRMFGGLACADGWRWQTDVRTEIAPSEGVPITLEPGDGTTHLEDIDATAPAATLAGASSIAVIAAGTAAEIVRCRLHAESGADGAAGSSGAPAPASESADPGRDACSAGFPVTPGGEEVAVECPSGDVTVGGAGGNSPSTGAGDAGAPGLPGDRGTAGEGQPEGASSWSCRTVGKGGDGADGAEGAAGAGATALGSASAAGVLAANGSAGAFGKPGQGGGGGGASSSAGACAAPLGGASGGSGGPGGCGGAPGGGGGGGGSSIALLSFHADVSLRASTLVVSRGGLGGVGGDATDGAEGSPGGSGGFPSAPALAGCEGGSGGHGGRGGHGGGGRGGHSIGIAFVGPAVAQQATAITVAPGPAAGGLGGGASALNAGLPGLSSPVLELAAEGG